MKIVFPVSKKFYYDASKRIFDNKKSVIYFTHDNFFNKYKIRGEVLETKKFYQYHEFNKIKVSYKLRKKYILDKKYQKYQKYFTKVFDRTAYVKKSDGFKRLLFLKQYLYFNNYLTKNKITHVFFSATPHMGWSIPFFYACKKNKIKTIISHLTDIPSFCLLRESWENNKFIKIKNCEIKYYEKIIKNNLLNTSLWTKKIRDRFVKGNYLTDHIKFWKFFFHKVLFCNNSEIIDSCFFYDGNISKFQKLTYFLKFYFHTLILNINYFKHSNKTDFKKEYVYFALHYQPERTTIPESFFYGDQLEAIKRLRSAIPKNITIIVKEHPVQLLMWHPRPSQIKYRSLSFYKKIKQLKNVQLSKISENSEKLIANSKLVATMTGSSGWEGLKKNKKVIVFGYPWYSRHPNCYIFKQLDKKKVLSILNNSPSIMKNYNFLKQMKKYFFQSWVADHVTKSTEYKNLVINASNVFKTIFK
ncbi:MAG: hypothetical protein CMM90_00340 [Rickettsiales bacterium]|nr:hypothetical protein [Rickettsiales bacterium]|tara:strand:- start:1029 stop:2444 length:1416 start_codon:yes stop_codon:yes gene_type:complete